MNDELETGKLLIADPFLKDPNFIRSVVFLCNHQADGSIGFVLNKKFDKNIGELVSDLELCRFAVYTGGPVQKDTIHFLHRRPDLVSGGVEVLNGIYWGGEFEELCKHIRNNTITEKDMRFFIGYSGWSEGQLEEEMTEKTWLTTEGTSELVFETSTSLVWQNAIKQIGGKYEQIINYPIDPQLN